VPAGAFVRPAAWLAFALALPRAVIAASLAIAAPALAAAVAIQTGVAIVSRIVPRLGNFSLAFPIVFAGALIVTIVTLPLLAPLGAHPWLVLPFAGQP
jgi:flagellar biosynthesis protein FliR